MNTLVPECIGHLYTPWSLAAAGSTSGCMAREGNSVWGVVAMSEVGFEARVTSVPGADVPDLLPESVIAVRAVGYGVWVAGALSWCEGGMFVRSRPRLGDVDRGGCLVVANLTGKSACATVFGSPGVMRGASLAVNDGSVDLGAGAL